MFRKKSIYILLEILGFFIDFVLFANAQEYSVLEVERKFYYSTPLRILIAEDDDINFLVLKRILEKKISPDDLISITRAKNGKDAFDIFKRNRDFSILFTDYSMPYMNGLQLTYKVRELDNKIFIIGMTDQNKKSDFMTAGVNLFLSKPLDIKLLKENFQYLPG